MAKAQAGQGRIWPKLRPSPMQDRATKSKQSRCISGQGKGRVGQGKSMARASEFADEMAAEQVGERSRR
jgi:hypothetical protein